MRKETKLTYRVTALFFFPLLLNVQFMSVSHSIINAGLARLDGAITALAAFSVAMVLENFSPEARELAARFDLSPYFAPVYTRSFLQAQEWLNQRRVDGIVHLEGDFSPNFSKRGTAKMQLIIKGIDSNRARQIKGYARGVLEKWAIARRAREDRVASPAVTIR